MTTIIHSVKDWILIRRSLKDQSLGFIPTMGALHAGHLELVKKSLSENTLTMVSVFVNPTQFNDPKDYEKYPIQVEQDIELLRGLGVNYVFLPQYSEIYADQYRYQVTEKELSHILCGAHRPGHFDGVLTVVLKLLNLAQAQRAYFGEKDFQQLSLIQGMVEAFFIPTQIIAHPTVREVDGLAMSSRNVRLSPEDRRKSVLFPKILKDATSCESARAELERNGFIVDYIEERFGRRLGAVRLGDVRLIDNVQR
jgi:pantoate--beta-alanine ligase